MEKSSAEVNRRVKLKNLFDEEIIVEESSEQDQSVFAPIYKKARKLVNDFKKDSKDNKDEYRQEELQIVNTISFEGRRGTGKTSAMMSFCNQLRKEKEKDTNKKDLFIVLDYIDASALEEGESILEIVLANMYHLLVEHMEKHNRSAQYNYEARNIIRKFEEIYDAIGFINERRNKNDRKVDLSPLSGLERLSNSQQLKKKVYELIRDYKKHIASENAMLVIPIDDIDMCFQSEEPSVYEIMETLHRYLMIPNVIIFLTYDYPELLSGCEKHFSQMHYIKDDITRGQKDHIREAANRYLEKVLPTYARIHLPSQRKRDYSDQNNIQVCLEHDEAIKYLNKFYLKEYEVQPVNLNPKEFALKFKASNCGLFYDSQGKKRHFAEPTDFRDMVHIVTICKQLNDSYEKNTDDDDELVFKELLDDLYFRFARVNLVTEEEQKLYKGYLEVNIERRSRNILDDIRRKISEQIITEKNKDRVLRVRIVKSDETINTEKYVTTHQYKIGLSRIKYIDTNIKGEPDDEIPLYRPIDEVLDRNHSYSYGELLYGLYCASSSGAFSKPLIWCILDSYTIMLTKLHRSVERKKKEFLKNNEENELSNYTAEKLFLKELVDELNEDDAYKSIKKIVGPSISSSWSNLFVPKIKQKVEGGDGEVPGIPDTARVGAIKYNDFYSKSNQFFQWDLGFKKDVNKRRRGEKKQRNIVQTIEIMCMFFTNVKDKDGKEGFQILYNDGNDPDIVESDKREYFTFGFSSGCFNIMNFVNNLFFGEEFFYNLHEQLKNSFKSFWGLSGETSDEAYYQRMRKFSLFEKYDDWKSSFKSCAMPLYSFDMMYNIMKRQYTDTLKKHPYIINEEVDVHDYLVRLINVYGDIREALKKQDAFYKTEINSEKRKEEAAPVAQFERAFINCPFMIYMNDINNSIEKHITDERLAFLQDFFEAIALSH